MINNYPKFIALLIVVCCFIACKQERLPCGQPTTMSVVLRCKQVIGVDTLNNPVLTDTILSSPVLRTFDTAGDTLVLRSLQSASKLIVHMSPVSDSCIWLVKTDSTGAISDSISFHYQRELTFLSNACGYAYFYNLTTVSALSHHFIDSVKIVDPNVTTNVNTEHVKIFIHRP